MIKKIIESVDIFLIMTGNAASMFSSPFILKEPWFSLLPVRLWCPLVGLQPQRGGVGPPAEGGGARSERLRGRRTERTGIKRWGKRSGVSSFDRKGAEAEQRGRRHSHALSAPPVTRLKIKIKIKCDGGSRAAAIAPPSMKRGCKGDNWLNITRCTAASGRERGCFHEAGQRSPPR